MCKVDRVLNDVDLVLHRRCDVDGGVGDDQRMRIGRHIHHEAMADSPCGAQPRLAPHDGAHELVGVQTSLHQRLGLPFTHELDRFRSGCLAVGRIDDRNGFQIDVVLFRQRFDAGSRSNQDRRDQPEVRRLDGTPQRAFVAGMYNRRWRRRQRLAEVEQTLIFLVGQRQISRYHAVMFTPPSTYSVSPDTRRA